MSKRSSGDVEQRERGSELLSLNQRPPGGASRCRGASSEGRAFSERDSSPRLLAFVAAGLLLAALPVVAQMAHKAKPKAPALQEAIIENTGSTNTQGYRIHVGRFGSHAGSVEVRYSGGENGKPGQFLPLKINDKFFHDLDAAMPLSVLPMRHGMRSSSFGTRTYVTYKGQRSPDLTLGGNARANTIKADVVAITQALHVSNVPRRPMVLHLNGSNTP